MVNIYTKSHYLIQPVYVTLIAAAKCPYCKAASKELDWIQRILFPHFKYSMRGIGEINPDISARSYESLLKSSFDVTITEYYHQFEGHAPITIIGDLGNPNGTLVGCDKFFSMIDEFPREVIQRLPQQQLQLIQSEALDGVNYSAFLYDNYIQPITGIVNDTIVQNLEFRKKQVREILEALSAVEHILPSAMKPKTS